MLAALSPVAGVLAVPADVKWAQVYVSFRQILRACEGPRAPEPFKIACMYVLAQRSGSAGRLITFHLAAQAYHVASALLRSRVNVFTYC